MKNDPTLLAASMAFAGACAFGSAMAIRHDVPGEPLGIATPLSVPRGILLGWGAGVAAPWPLPMAALIAATRAPRDGSIVPAVLCEGLGLACIAGTLIEPVTYRRRSWTSTISAAILVNLASSVALVVIGRLQGRRRPSRH
jgi:hypothetical protein